MRLILKEYLDSLKEDGELDALLVELINAMGITTTTKPQKGRQHGVDIPAMGKDPEDNIKKVFLLVVKQGNFTRSMWNATQSLNSVRPSFDDIFDTYIPTYLSPHQKSLPKKIILATNGYMDQTISQTWGTYISGKSVPNQIEFEFWGTDQLIPLIEKYLLNESLFPEEYRSLLLKTLAFLELRDYDLNHFQKLVRGVLTGTGTKKQIIKQFRLVSLCMNILHKWCRDLDNLKPVLIASEWLLLNIWDLMRTKDLFQEQYVNKEYHRLYQFRLNLGVEYLNKVGGHAYVKDSLSNYSRNPLEYSLTTWEEIGHLSVIGFSEFWKALLLGDKNKETSEKSYENARVTGITLGNLILNNSPAKHPKYDEHCIEITLGMMLLFSVEQYDVAKVWLNNLIVGLSDAFIFEKFFPLFTTDYDKLVRVELKQEPPKINSSMLITILAEWCVILEMEDQYKLLKDTISAHFPEVNLQLWFPELETEDRLYSSDAGDTGSTKTSIELPDKMQEYKQEMVVEFEKFTIEKDLSALRYLQYPIAFMAHRHYRSYPLPYFWRFLVAKNAKTDETQ